MMKLTAVSVICVVAMATTEGFILPPFARFGPFPFGMMRPFPGMLHPAMAMPYPSLMGIGGAYPYGPGLAPYMAATNAAAAPAPAPAAAPAAMVDVVTGPVAQGSAPAYDTAAVVNPNGMGTYPVY